MRESQFSGYLTFIFFVTSLKQDDIPGFQTDLTKEGIARYGTSTENKTFQIRRIMSAVALARHLPPRSNVGDSPL